LGKRFGIPHTFGFENVGHDVCEEASLVIWKVLSLLFFCLSRWMSHTRGCWQYRYQYRENKWQEHFPFYGKGSLSSMPITYRLMYATGVYQKEQR
jgi:hypothetical protein